jgi:hypothetical protein
MEAAKFRPLKSLRRYTVKKIFYLFLTVSLVLLSTSGVMATTYTFMDTTLVQPWKGNSPTGAAWTDVEGENYFNTYQVDVTLTGNDVKFEIYTNYPSTGHNFGGSIGVVPPADLALDLDGNGVFEKGVALSAHDGLTVGQLYDVTTWKSAQQLFGPGSPGTYGGRYGNPSDAKVPYTKIAAVSGTGILASVDTNWNPIGSNPDYRVDVVLDGVNSLGDWDNLTFFWGTGTCDNDGITGTVPLPPSILLLGSGLLGLCLLRGRNPFKA